MDANPNIFNPRYNFDDPNRTESNHTSGQKRSATDNPRFAPLGKCEVEDCNVEDTTVGFGLRHEQVEPKAFLG